MAERVFLSYAHQDRDIVRRLEPRLRAMSVVAADDEVVDPQLLPINGDDAQTIIRAQMRDADRVVIIASESAAESPWVNYEAGMASALDKPVVMIAPRGSHWPAFAAALPGLQTIEVDDLA